MERIKKDRLWVTGVWAMHIWMAYMGVFSIELIMFRQSIPFANIFIFYILLFFDFSIQISTSRETNENEMSKKEYQTDLQIFSVVKDSRTV